MLWCLLFFIVGLQNIYKNRLLPLLFCKFKITIFFFQFCFFSYQFILLNSGNGI